MKKGLEEEGSDLFKLCDSKGGESDDEDHMGLLNGFPISIEEISGCHVISVMKGNNFRV